MTQTKTDKSNSESKGVKKVSEEKSPITQTPLPENVEFDKQYFDFWSCQFVLENKDLIIFDHSIWNKNKTTLVVLEKRLYSDIIEL